MAPIKLVCEALAKILELSYMKKNIKHLQTKIPFQETSFISSIVIIFIASN